MLENILRSDNSTTLDDGKVKLMADLQEIQDDEMRQLIHDNNVCIY